jgi:predicted Ser/Thr protein kinase
MEVPEVLPTALVVADLFDEGHAIVDRFRALGFDARLCVGGEDAMVRLQASAPAVLYIDCWEARMDGLSLLRLSAHYHPDLPSRTITRVPGGGASAQGTDLVALGVRTIAPLRLSIDALAEAIEQATGTDISTALKEAARLDFPDVEERGEDGDLSPGVLVADRYGIFGILGRGTSSTVYEVVDTAEDRGGFPESVALKLLLPGAPGADPAGALLREFEVTAGVDHPNVVRSFDRGEHEGMAFITLELIRGDSLADWLERQETFPVAEETFKLLAGGARGIEAMHAGGMVHRDVKPGNLLIDERTGRLTLIDFGATLLPDAPERTNPTGILVGTPTYVSPEQLRGETDGTVRSDLFSLGVVLYEALTGRRPFRGGTVKQLLHRIAEAPPVAPIKVNPAIPQALSDTILRMLSKRPELRPVNVAEVLEALAEGREPPTHSPRAVPEGSAEAALAALLDFDDEGFEAFDVPGPAEAAEELQDESSSTDEGGEQP